MIHTFSISLAKSESMLVMECLMMIAVKGLYSYRNKTFISIWNTKVIN